MLISRREYRRFLSLHKFDLLRLIKMLAFVLS